MMAQHSKLAAGTFVIFKGIRPGIAKETLHYCDFPEGPTFCPPSESAHVLIELANGECLDEPA